MSILQLLLFCALFTLMVKLVVIFPAISALAAWICTLF